MTLDLVAANAETIPSWAFTVHVLLRIIGFQISIYCINISTPLEFKNHILNNAMPPNETLITEIYATSSYAVA